MNIDEIYESPSKVREAIETLEWRNAIVESVFIGYEDHGLLTVSIGCSGGNWSSWGQSFGNQALIDGDAFKNFIEGCLSIMRLSMDDEQLIRVGREPGKTGSSGRINAIRPRPSRNDFPVFWPGADVSRFYVFDADGNYRTTRPHQI